MSIRDLFKSDSDDLERIISALERQAAATERLALAAEWDALRRLNVVLNADLLTEEELESLENRNEQLETDQFTETSAVVELLEVQGIKVPEEIYRRLGRTPPSGHLAPEIDESSFSAPQPQPEPAQPAEPSKPADLDESGLKIARKSERKNE